MRTTKTSMESGRRAIESRQNARVKELRARLRERAEKNDGGPVAVEGAHLIAEAARSGLKLRTVFVRAGSEERLDRMGGAAEEVLVLTGEVFRSAAVTENPQGVAALVERPRFQLETILRPARGPALIAVAAGIQDPGNLGTLARSAEAFGASGMILLPGTADLWNGKAMRASAGSVFRLPSVEMAEDEAFLALRAAGVQAVAAVARGGEDSGDAALAQPVALVLGNEGAGLAPETLARCEGRVTIPCPGPVESLNAAVAASVLLYEAARQRRMRP